MTVTEIAEFHERRRAELLELVGSGQSLMNRNRKRLNSEVAWHGDAAAALRLVVHLVTQLAGLPS